MTETPVLIPVLSACYRAEKWLMYDVKCIIHDVIVANLVSLLLDYYAVPNCSF